MQKILILLFITLSFSLFAQDELYYEDITPPFVSDINVSIEGRQVKINWKNPIDYPCNLLVYRSENIIQDIKNATLLATLTKQENEYQDILSGGSHYYAVLVQEKESKLLYQLFIPYRNITMTAIRLQKDDDVSLKSIKATSRNSINVTWDYSLLKGDKYIGQKNVFLFRNTVPITTEEVLDKSTPIGSFLLSDRYLEDNVPSGVEYFYYISIENSALEFIPDVTYTTNATVVDSGKSYINSNILRRFRPLPLMVYHESPLTGKKINRIAYLDFKVGARSSDNLFDFLDKDIISPKEPPIKSVEFSLLSDEDSFKTTLFNSLYKQGISKCESGDFTGARSTFESLIMQPLPDELSIRASYYLGLIYFTTGNYYQSYLFLNTLPNIYKEVVKEYLSFISKQVYVDLKG